MKSVKLNINESNHLVKIIKNEIINIEDTSNKINEIGNALTFIIGIKKKRN